MKWDYPRVGLIYARREETSTILGGLSALYGRTRAVSRREDRAIGSRIRPSTMSKSERRWPRRSSLTSGDEVVTTTTSRPGTTKTYWPPYPHAKQVSWPAKSRTHQPYPYFLSRVGSGRPSGSRERSKAGWRRATPSHDFSTQDLGTTCCPLTRPSLRYTSPNASSCRGVISMSLPPK